MKEAKLVVKLEVTQAEAMKNPAAEKSPLVQEEELKSEEKYLTWFVLLMDNLVSSHFFMGV